MKFSISPNALYTFDLNEVEAHLNSLPGSVNNSFSNNVWRFTNSNEIEITIDFSSLKKIEDEFPKWVRSFGIDLVQISKEVWLHLADSTSVNMYSSRFTALFRLWTILAQQSITRITQENITKVIAFMLTHHWYNGRAVKITSIVSSAHLTQSLPLEQLKWAFSSLSLDLISRDVTDAFLRKKLKVLISELTDNSLSYRDWIEGGSFNTLTLDYGRYYVEHCLDFFDRNIPLAIALASTFRAVPHIAKSLGYSNTTVSDLLPKILQGHSAECINDALFWGLTTIQRVQNGVLSYFKEVYRKVRFESQLLKKPLLYKFVKECGLPPSVENLDRMRVIIWEYKQRNDERETKCLLEGCQPSVSIEKFSKLIRKFARASFKEPCDVPTQRDYLDFGLVERISIKDASRSYPRQMIKLAESAGLTCMVALTGWRKCEFGFPFSAILRSTNDDKLDEYAFPYRYKVDWYVSKSHGNIRQLREITFNTTVIAGHIKQLIGAGIDAPCLYSTSHRKGNVFLSGQKVDWAVVELWESFVENYSGFKLLDDWKIWQNLREMRASRSKLSNHQRNERDRLLRLRTESEWDTLKIDGNLKETWIRARKEWQILNFSSYGRQWKAKKDWIIKYRNGTLRSDWIQLLNTHLSQPTKEWIMSLNEDECKSLVFSRQIGGELLAGTLYPSPHAFRHMWAEAVYRRFDGDAGWMIRSQFKHISSTMWLAYIRDKDNRFGHQRVKSQVINSLVSNYIAKKGEGYAGQMHIWLRRLTLKTTVLNTDEQIQFARQIVTREIEDIKANPWSYCLLKRRTREKAKCAEEGEPMRHNASPELCSGCVHNLMQSTNVEWILFHVASHLETLKTPLVPEIFKAASYKFVKNITRHVQTLDPEHEALCELQAALQAYRSSRNL